MSLFQKYFAVHSLWSFYCNLRLNGNEILKYFFRSTFGRQEGFGTWIRAWGFWQGSPNCIWNIFCRCDSLSIFFQKTNAVVYVDGHYVFYFLPEFFVAYIRSDTWHIHRPWLTVILASYFSCLCSRLFKSNVISSRIITKNSPCFLLFLLCCLEFLISPWFGKSL